MEPNPLFQFNLRDVYRILFRHKHRSLAVGGGVLLLALAAAILCPQSYVSEAQLLVNVGVESLNTDPTANRSSAVSLQVARAEEIKSLLDLFRARAVAQEVVEEVGVDAILQRSEDDAGFLSSALKSAQGHAAFVFPSKRISNREKAVLKVRKMVTVTAEAKSNVIRVTAKAGSPELAQKVADAYVKAAKGKHGKAHEMKNTTPFLRTKLADVKNELQQTATRLRDVKNRVGVASVEGRKKTLEEQIRQLQLNIVTARSNKQAFADKIEKRHAEFGDLPIATDSASSLTARGLDEMHARLYQLRIEARGLQSRLTPGHHRYKATLKQIADAERDLSIEELRFATSSIASLNSQIDAFDTELEQKRSDLRQLNQDEAELKSLNSEVALLQRRYESYNADLANSQIIEDRRKQQISNINVFQEATFVETPSSPKRKVIFALGFAVAIFAAAGVALASEFLDGSIKTPEEAEAELGLPVLEVMPFSRRPMALRC